MTRETLLLIALQSGALFLALWGIFRLIPSIPANAKAWMWRLAFLKPLLSLLPFAVVTLPVLPMGEVAPVRPSLIEAEPVMEMSTISEAVSSAPISAAVTPEPGPEANLSIDPLLTAWYLGVILVAAYGLRGMYRSLRAVQQAEPVERIDLQSALGELLARARVHKPTRLLSSDHVQSAMLVGGRSYSILLPREVVESGSFQDLRLMLAHEVAHIARQDLVWFGLTSAVQSIFFFNPMVWIAARCSRLDHESATDRHASQLAGVPVQTYAEMLLRATVVTRPSLAPGSLPMAESYRTIHRRLEAMKHFNAKPTFWRKTATAALAMLTLSLLPAYELSAAAYPDEFYPEDQTLYAQTSAQDPAKPAVQVTAKPAKASKKSTNTRYITVPVKAVVGKNKKTYYYVWTKKGYVEVSARTARQGLAKNGTVSVVRPTVVDPKAAKNPATIPITKPPAKARISNPVRAIAIDPTEGQAKVGIASSDPVTTSNVAGTGQVVTVDPTKAPATTVGRQTISTATSNRVETQGQASPTTTNVSAAYGALGQTGKGSLTSAYTTLAQGKATPGAATKALGKGYQSVYGKLGTTTGLQPQPSSVYGAVATAKGTQNKASHNSVAYRALLAGQEKGKAQSTFQLFPAGQSNKKVQIVNMGDGKVKIIDSNGKTKVIELKKGGIYEIEGDTVREVKPERGTTGKSGITSLYYNLNTSPNARYQVRGKDGTWQIVPFKDSKSTLWRYYIKGKEGDTWRIVPSKDGKGETGWRYQIFGPDGKPKTVEPVKKSDPPKTSKGEEPTAETLG